VLLITESSRVVASALALSFALSAMLAHAAWQDIPDSISLQQMGDKMAVNGARCASWTGAAAGREDVVHGARELPLLLAAVLCLLWALKRWTPWSLESRSGPML
jgi:hypothetical protein